jgi:hypothetical protein
VFGRKIVEHSHPHARHQIPGPDLIEGFVAGISFRHGGDGRDDRIYPQHISHEPCVGDAGLAGHLVRHEDENGPFPPERPHGNGRRYRRIHATRQADDPLLDSGTLHFEPDKRLYNGQNQLGIHPQSFVESVRLLTH